MLTIIIAIFLIYLMIGMDSDLVIENLALRQQLAIMKQSVKRPRIRNVTAG